MGPNLVPFASNWKSVHLSDCDLSLERKLISVNVEIQMTDQWSVDLVDLGHL